MAVKEMGLDLVMQEYTKELKIWTCFLLKLFFYCPKANAEIWHIGLSFQNKALILSAPDIYVSFH